MKSRLHLFSILIFSTLIAVLHLYAFTHFWYWKFWWFDILMHGLGGIVIALIGLWIVWHTHFLSLFIHGDVVAKYKFGSRIVISLIFTLLIGSLWEIFEIAIDPLFLYDGYRIDTIIDIIMDTLGAFVAAFFSFFLIPRHE